MFRLIGQGDLDEGHCMVDIVFQYISHVQEVRYHRVVHLENKLYAKAECLQ